MLAVFLQKLLSHVGIKVVIYVLLWEKKPSRACNQLDTLK